MAGLGEVAGIAGSIDRSLLKGALKTARTRGDSLALKSAIRTDVTNGYLKTPTINNNLKEFTHYYNNLPSARGHIPAPRSTGYSLEGSSFIHSVDEARQDLGWGDNRGIDYGRVPKGTVSPAKAKLKDKMMADRSNRASKITKGSITRPAPKQALSGPKSAEVSKVDDLFGVSNSPMGYM